MMHLFRARTAKEKADELALYAALYDAQVDRNPKGGNEVPSRSDESPVAEGDAP